MRRDSKTAIKQQNGVLTAELYYQVIFDRQGIILRNYKVARSRLCYLQNLREIFYLHYSFAQLNALRPEGRGAMLQRVNPAGFVFNSSSGQLGSQRGRLRPRVQG